MGTHKQVQPQNCEWRVSMEPHSLMDTSSQQSQMKLVGKIYEQQLVIFKELFFKIETVSGSRLKKTPVQKWLTALRYDVTSQSNIRFPKQIIFILFLLGRVLVDQNKPLAKSRETNSIIQMIPQPLEGMFYCDMLNTVRSLEF